LYRSAVINELQDHLEDSETLAYFYCDFRQQQTTDSAVVLRSLLSQLLQSSTKDWLPLFKDLEKRHSQGAPPPTDLNMLIDLLLRISMLHDHPIIVIDALDECKDFSSLVKELVQLNVDGSVQIFVTSRAEQAIIEAFTDITSISLSDMVGTVKGDIQIHLDSQLSTRPRLAKLSTELKEKIWTALLNKADGM
jgi:hypothetical protein